MKKTLKKLGLFLWLIVHSFVVVCIPVTTWIVAAVVRETWLYIVATLLFCCVQVPIEIYAVKKPNSLFDKIIAKIKNLKD